MTSPFRPLLAAFLVNFACLTAAASAGLTLVGQLDNKHGTTSGVSYSGCWGYVAPDGREYAILTTATGTAIIDITDTSDIHEIVHITGPTSLWREVRTHRDRLYVVTEAGGGTQIIDLSQLPDTATLVKSFTYTAGPKNTSRAHTIEIFDGYMYLNGCANWGTTAERGAVIFSLADPDNPAFVGEYSPNYFHDSYVRNDTLFGAAIYSGGGIYIADISNKAVPVPIGKISYTGSGTHNVWLTKSGSHIISTDEIGSTAKNLKFWDLSTLPTVPTTPVSTYAVNPTDIGHNVFVRGDYAYAAWYTAGIAVANIANVSAPFTAGSYDTSTLPPGYDGVWAVYPYFWSGKVIAGDMQNGLYVFTFDSLLARTPSTLIEPADSHSLLTPDPVLFRWTRVADPVRDPHTYRLVIEGSSYDTTINTGTDTSFLFTDVVGMGGGPFSWHVLTVDEVNSISTQDTFFLQKPAITVHAPNGGEAVRIGSVADIDWLAESDSVEIAYSTDGGTGWMAIATVSGSPGSYAWTVPSTPCAEALLRIRNTADSTASDESDAPFVIYAAAVPMEEGWNLVSAPSEVLDPSPEANFPSAESAPFAYAGGYSPAGAIAPGTGYWIKYGTEVDEQSVGYPIETDTIPVSAKWNIVGALTEPVPASSVQTEPGTMTLTGFFGYSPTTGYFTADTLRPGAGYWVKCSEPGSLILDAGLAAVAASSRTIAGRDAADGGRGGASNGGAAAGKFSLQFSSEGKTRTLRFPEGDARGPLPPPPPGDEFDVRFAEGTAARRLGSALPARIEVRGASDGAEVRLGGADGTSAWTDGNGGAAEGYTLREITPLGTGTAIALSATAARLGPAPGGDRGTRVFLLAAGDDAATNAPAEFRLRQNHPNPFNPSTVIGYDLPAESRVLLEVYSVIGERVATLVDGIRPAGAGSAVFEGEGLPTGTYFYRLSAGGTTLVGKMLLAR